MRIWWGHRFLMEAFVFFGVSFYFLSPGGYIFNYRKKYPFHRQKRERCKLIYIDINYNIIK